MGPKKGKNKNSSSGGFTATSVDDFEHVKYPTPERTCQIKFHVLCPSNEDDEKVELILYESDMKEEMHKIRDHGEYSEYQCSITRPVSRIESSYRVKWKEDKSFWMPTIITPGKDVIKQYHAFIADTILQKIFYSKSDQLLPISEIFFHKILSKISRLPSSEVWTIKEIVDDIAHIVQCLDEKDKYKKEMFKVFITAVVQYLWKDLEKNIKFLLAYLAVEVCIRLQETLEEVPSILCKNLLLDNTDPCTWNDMFTNYFQNNFQNGKMIKDLCKMCAQNGDPNWLYCIPLIHFQYNCIRPFQENSHSFKTKAWWGVVYIQDIINIFAKSTITEDVVPVLKKLKEFYLVDSLLPQSLVAALPQNQFRKGMKTKLLNLDACLGRMRYELQTDFDEERYDTSMELITGLISPDEGSGIDQCNEILVDHLKIVIQKKYIKSIPSTLQVCFKIQSQMTKTKEINNYINDVAACLENSRVGLTVFFQISNRLLIVCSEENDWRKKMLEMIQRRIMKCSISFFMEAFLVVYKSIDPDMMNILCDHTSRIAPQLQRLGPNYMELLSIIFSHNWPQSTDVSVIMNYIFHWTSFKDFVIYYRNKKNQLTQKCSEAIANGIEAFREFIEDFRTGDITGLMLDTALEKKAQMTALAKIIDPEIHIEKFIKDRTSEKKLFTETKKEIKFLLDIGKLVNMGGYEDLVEKLEANIEQYPWIEICDSKGGKPDITYFGIPSDLKKNIKRIKELSSSRIFQNIIRENKDLENDLSNINSKIIEPTFEKWNQYCHRFEDGHVAFEDIDKLFDSLDSEQISAELKMMMGTVNFPKVLKKIQMYKCYKISKETTDLILQMKTVLKLQGSFKTIEAALNIGEKRGELDDLDEKTCTEMTFLDEYTQDRLECLRTFLKCEKLRMWISETIPDLEALSVFVDMATISAGEGASELQKVMCLHSCVIGYAPLLFNLTTESDFDTLHSRFKEVWNALARDDNLPQKMEGAEYELDWLTTVMTTHGSVEISSMFLAQKMNNAGIYHIGANDQAINQDLDSIIRVSIYETDEEPRKFSFKEISDLQSRLMLVVGNANQENENVKAFSDVFDSITHLGKAFLKLYKAGNILYQYMTIVCYTSSKIPTSILVNFPGMEPMKCDKKSGENIAQQIGKISSFFERCLFPWTNYIEETRDEWYEMNYYTIHQINFLQNQIATIKKTANMDHRVYPLLSAVKKYCSHDDVLKAIKDSEKTMEEQAKKQKCTGYKKGDPTQEFIDEILEAGFTIEDALEALARFKIDEIDKVMIWLMERSDSGGEEDKEEEKADLWETLSKEIALEGTSKSLIENLEQIWKKFMTAATLDHANIVSLESVGIILHHLSDDSPIKRNFSRMLKKGQPNLVVCSQDDILYTTMSIYMESKDQPLPQADEILFCTKNTTVEQVDIFIKRAMLCKDEGKIYCMMYADLLHYDASDKVERQLQKYLNKCLDYKLVIICSEENEYKCRITAALEEFCCSYKCLFQLKEIKDYIEKKFQSENVPAGIGPASKIDVYNSSVRLIHSWRPGCGKTLYKNTLVAKLKELNENHEEFSISLHEDTINTDRIMKSILPLTDPPEEKIVRLFHFDIALEVKQGVDYLLFNLLILGQLVDDHGFVWLRQPYDIYLVETLSLAQETSQDNSKTIDFLHQILKILPDITCRTPTEALKHYKEKCFAEKDQFFHEQKFTSEQFKKTFKHLKTLETNAQAEHPDKSVCLEVILRYCGIEDPTWSQLTHFVKFLYIQLIDIEKSIYCNQSDMFFGFRQFVLKFILQMSQDFANVTLNLSEESSNAQPDEEHEEIERFQLRRRWETSPHPYLFFNDDQMSITFLGFNIDRKTGNLVDPHSSKILERNIMKSTLYDELCLNNAPLNENFDILPRLEKIRRLCNVMEVKEVHDPDPTYELTADNVKKMLAIYMRARCDIPVVVMGETGCGKTRLIKFMCQLQVPTNSAIQNMVIMKIHGGTTRQDIINKINYAINLSKENAKEVKSLKTILFFDEANTTEAIGMIKDIMCDKIIDGKPFDNVEHLKIVAACNPYRKHSDDMIEKLKQAGLGYNIDEKMTTDKFGQIPMRHLVYRVKPLPPSMLSLVWDFGQLDKETEQLYIHQMVASHNENNQWDEKMMQTISKILVESQCYMRQQKNECSFVSLRNVERTLLVMNWFSKQNILHEQCDKNLDITTRSLILALGLCYHSSLQNRAEYREHVSQFFVDPCKMPGKGNQILQEIHKCQNTILSNVRLESTVAKNQALLENVFMMAVCIELRIPLFLVGKPGSSKSLAKTILANAMQGKRARTEFFKQMKQAQMISFQCSPLSTAEGILSVFSQGNQFQKDQDLNSFVSVVVLDEIGLAEDSPKMPLKVLHPLIEDGCVGDEVAEPYKKVGFIGISNWALDPAKMNRGISVQRDSPGIEELVSTAKGICSSNKDVQKDRRKDVLEKIEHIFKPVAQAYLNLLIKATNERREFFGLRDFYSMVKMIFASANNGELTWPHIAHAIKRNFGGLDSIESLNEFEEHLQGFFDVTEKSHHISLSTTAMIESCLDKDAGSERRYLLLLMENYTDLNMIKQHILSNKEATMIFGSSFPHDQYYAKICRDINKIKICMEIGKTVILMNLENLYESLYDALNQFYVRFGGDKFVDLGLGTHRIKCKVHNNFRLIVIAEKSVVYAKFPIPLINRLEKHYLTLSSFHTQDEEELVIEIKDKLRLIINESEWKTSFVGFTESSLAAIVLHVCRAMQLNPAEETSRIISIVEKMLLKIATPDAIVKIYKKNMPDSRRIADTYFNEQKHDNITDFLTYNAEDNYYQTPFTQITTYNKMLAKTDLTEISDALRIKEKQIVVLNMEAFDTEMQFRFHVRKFFENGVATKQMLIIQCLSIDNRLIVNAQNIIQDEFDEVYKQNKDLRRNIKVFFIIQLCILEQSGFSGFQVGAWQSFHIDDLHKPPINMPPFMTMMDESFEDLFENSCLELSQKFGGPSLDVIKLLYECIPVAISAIKHGGGSERAIERINILNNLLEDEDFVDNLLHQIAASLKRKKNNSDPEHWLLKQTEQENRIKFGAFGNMILQCMKQKITGHLTRIISAVDINSNMDIPYNNNKEKWKRNLWITLFKDSQILEVASIPMNKQAYKIKLPFFWVFFQIIKNSQAEILTDGVRIPVVRLVKENSFFKELERFAVEFLELEDRNLFLKLYLEDFMQMTLECISPLHIEILESQMICAIKQLDLTWDVKDVTTSMVSIHEAFSKMEFRFQNFSSMVRLNPEIINELPTKCTSEEEMTMDVVALDHLLKLLEPKKSQLDEEEGRKEWIGSVLNHFPCVLPILKTEIENEALYGKSCSSSINGIKSSWTKIMTVKLFIHHMNPSKISGIRNGIKLCKALWSMLQSNADMKTIETFKKIELFLITCNKNAMKQLHNKCSMCSKEIDDASVKLPCQCISCKDCLKINSKCLKCDVPIPEDFQPDLTEISREALNKYNIYRDACNGFFMELISQLCFADGSSPSKEVFDKLMEYILKVNPGSENRIVTQEISICNDAIDPTPILRSFLIQLLMQAGKEDADQYLEEYMKRMENDMGDEKSFFKLTIILIIHCFEDDLLRRSTERGSELDDAIEALQSRIEFQEETTSLSLSKMRSLASVRFGLDICAKFMYKCYMEEKYLFDDKTEKLFDLARELCELQDNPLPKVFILKMLVHLYGQHACKKITDHCPWIIPVENQDESVLIASDYFAVWEEDYIKVRNCFAGVKIGCERSFVEITEIFNEKKENTHINSVLAIYREITCRMLFPEKQRISEMQIQEIKNKCDQYDFLKTDIVKDLFENIFGKCCPQLTVKENLDLNNQGLIAMLVHYFVVLKNSNENHFFKQVLENPDAIKDSFFPTMPEDLTNAIVQALKENNQAFKMTYTLNECPNGHLYVIGNCGLAYYTDKCRTCGAVFGGKSHIFAEGNKISDGQDKTRRGYILESVKESETILIERDMDSASTILMRLFLHSSMFLAANENPQVISGMIEKLDDGKNVVDFLQEHIFNNLEQLRKALGKNSDDIFLLIHFIIKQMVNNMPGFQDSQAALKTKEDRKVWEKNFSETYFKPHVLNMEKILDKYKTKISEDTSNANILLSLSNQFDNLSDDTSLAGIENETQLWQYRPHITMEHFKSTLSNKIRQEEHRKQLGVLDIFFEMDHQLFALRFLPDIIKLHSILLRKYQHKLGFQQAKELTVHNFLEKIHSVTARKEVSALVDSFIQAWEYIKRDLQKYECMHGNQPLTEHQEHCDEELNLDSELAYFIPCTKGPGVCSYALLKFLIFCNNEFMEKYYWKIDESTRNLSEVSLSEVRQMHVIDFDPDRDFYFLVLPNSNFKFSLNDHMKIEYNFIGFQHQLEDRFLSGKCKIKRQKFETIIFRGDISNIPLFDILGEKIEQTPITKTMKYQISQELKDLTRIYTDLEYLETIILFLINNSGVSEKLLSTFMSNVLQMKTEFSSNKVKEFCELKHAKSLWFVLNMKIEKLLVPTNYSKTKFETVKNDFKADFIDEKTALTKIFKDWGNEALDDFISVLFEFIFCYLPNLETNLTEESLKDNLQVFLDDDLGIHLDLGTFPDEIKIKNTVATWTLAVKILENQEDI